MRTRRASCARVSPERREMHALRVMLGEREVGPWSKVNGERTPKHKGKERCAREKGDKGVEAEMEAQVSGWEGGRETCGMPLLSHSFRTRSRLSSHARCPSRPFADIHGLSLTCCPLRPT